MRDPERIDPVIDAIRSVWKMNPDLRLMQLLGNCFSDDPYHTEDDRLVELLDATYLKEPPSPNRNGTRLRTEQNAGSNPVGGTTSEYAEGDCEICLHDGKDLEEEPCFTCLRVVNEVGKWERNPNI